MMNFIRKDEAFFLFLWGSGYIATKFAVPHAGTFSLLFYRYLLVVLIAGLWITYKNQWQRPDIRSAVYGFLAHFLWLVLVIKSIEFGLNAGIAALFAATQPMMTALFAPLFLKEKSNFLQWLGIVIGFIGVYVLVSGNAEFTGIPYWVYSLPLLATLSITLVTLWEKKSTLMFKDNLPIFTSLFWQSLVTMVLLLPFAYYFESFKVDWELEFLLSLGWLAIMISLVGYGMMFFLIRTRGATRVSSLQYFVPAITMLLAWVILGESFSAMGLIGLIITLIGFYLIDLGDKKQSLQLA